MSFLHLLHFRDSLLEGFDFILEHGLINKGGKQMKIIKIKGQRNTNNEKKKE
jgi:hypothetical protein